MNFIFHNIYLDVILLIDGLTIYQLIFFKMVIAPPTIYYNPIIYTSFNHYYCYYNHLFLWWLKPPPTTETPPPKPPVLPPLHCGRWRLLLRGRNAPTLRANGHRLEPWGRFPARNQPGGFNRETPMKPLWNHYEITMRGFSLLKYMNIYIYIIYIYRLKPLLFMKNEWTWIWLVMIYSNLVAFIYHWSNYLTTFTGWWFRTGWWFSIYWG